MWRMTDAVRVIVREPETVRISGAGAMVTVAQAVLPGPPGPPGPAGANGLGAISADPGNAITTGSDGGLYCPAVTTATTDW
jgi:hypothetical protein